MIAGALLSVPAGYVLGRVSRGYLDRQTGAVIAFGMGAIFSLLGMLAGLP